MRAAHQEPALLRDIVFGDGDEDSDDTTSLDFPINPEKVAPLMRRLISPTKLRAQVYDKDGNLVIDSRALFIYSDIVRSDLPLKTLLEDLQNLLPKIEADLLERSESAEVPDVGRL